MFSVFVLDLLLIVCRWKREWSGYDVSPSGEPGTFPKASSDVLLHEKTHSCVHFRKLCVWIESQPTQRQPKLRMLTAALCRVWFRTALVIPSVFLSSCLSMMAGLNWNVMTQDASLLCLLCWCIKGPKYLCKQGCSGKKQMGDSVIKAKPTMAHRQKMIFRIFVYLYAECTFPGEMIKSIVG